MLYLVAIINLVTSREFSVSGTSAGGAMATQLQVAFSSQVSGSGIVAGAPFYCAQNYKHNVYHQCQHTPGPDLAQTLLNFAKNVTQIGQIDDLSNLQNKPVYIYSGVLDTIVAQSVVRANQEFFNQTNSNILAEFNIESEHAFITNNYGNECSILNPPFINNCDYDQAGIILQHIYGKLEAPTAQIDENLKMFSQTQYTKAFNFTSMADNGFIYIPEYCNKNQCVVHIALHGCIQEFEAVGYAFVKNAGYNTWAESNNIIVIYPQMIPTDVINSKACWDWWGYTGPNYYSKQGVQMQVLYNMAQKLPVLEELVRYI